MDSRQPPPPLSGTIRTASRRFGRSIIDLALDFVNQRECLSCFVALRAGLAASLLAQACSVRTTNNLSDDPIIDLQKGQFGSPGRRSADSRRPSCRGHDPFSNSASI